jgi:5-methylcytosine-specific restriction protein A
MPYAPAKPCSQSGCMKLNCIEHAKAKRRDWQKRTDAKRPSASQRLYNRQWTYSSRPAFLMEHPLCEVIRYKDSDGQLKFIRRHEGRVVAASVVDHIVPHKGDTALFHDQSNWQALCRDCHNYKTAKLDGGFGNQTQSKSTRRVGGRSNL